MLESSLEVTVGDGVSFRFSVVNGGDSTVELTFRDACQADFAVYEDGDEVWRYSDDRMFAQRLTTAELQPGETAMFEEVWPDPDPGDYTAEATLRVVEHDIGARTPFSV
ncbi:MAG: hypothetical protein ACI8U4_002499 [Natronomonas sp.]|jgi:hypothetical protein